MKRRIAVYFTGGTISMRHDPQTNSTVPMLSGEDILNFMPGIRELADVQVIDFGCIPGTHMTLPLMMELAGQIRKTLAGNQIDGVVVTHGTDTLEETAYLVDLVVASEKPVVFVGAMYSSSELEWDGHSNLSAAICVAAAPAASGLGTLVVMNGQVLAASEATKAHTESLEAFESPNHGALGTVNDLQVTVRRRPPPHLHLAPAAAVEPVWLVKVAIGYDSTLINACVDHGAKGIVIEALGCGNVPPECVPGVKRAINSNIPVVMASRCFRGRVAGRYNYVGGGAHLRELGVMFAEFLSGQKARIKLSLALGVAKSPGDIREIFESN
jgi:L-asparaginase